MEDQKNLIGADELASKTRSFTLGAIATGPGIIGETANTISTPAARLDNKLQFN